MDAELYQEKMNKVHRGMLQQMLKVKILPEDLLERYLQVKTLVDRIDCHLTPGDLAMIIVSVGNNPEIATELLEADDKVIEKAVEQPVEELACLHEWHDYETFAKCGKCGRQSTDEKIMNWARSRMQPDKIKAAEIAGGQVSGATGQAAGPVEKPETDESKPDLPSPKTEEAKENTVEPPEADKPEALEPTESFWSLGMPVRVLCEDELRDGKIVGTLSVPGKPLQLTVEFEDGETETFDEEEVEAM